MFNVTQYTGVGPNYLHSIKKEQYAKYFSCSSKRCPISKYSLHEYGMTAQRYSLYDLHEGHIDVSIDSNSTIKISALRAMNKTIYLSASTKHGSKPAYLPLNISVNADLVDLERVKREVNQPPRFVAPPWSESIAILPNGLPDPA